MNTYMRQILVWLVPTIMLLLTLFSIPLPSFYALLLQIVVTLAAVYICYLLFTGKPKYYLVWGIVFILIALIYNPIVHVTVNMGVEVPLSLITALLFICNWFFVYRRKA